MYIALKWLFGMVMAMWVGLCTFDLYLKYSAQHMQLLSEFIELNGLMPPILKNSSLVIQQNTYTFEKAQRKIRPVSRNSFISQYITFVAGACLVIIYYRKNDLICYIRIKLKTLNKYEAKKHFRINLNYAATQHSIRVAILRILEMSAGIFIRLRIYLLTKYKRQKPAKRNLPNVNLLLLNKLREFDQERRNLGHILFAAIRENKNIQMRYQLESLAKKRLARHIEDTQKQAKENKSRYLSIQQLYLTSHQENNFLKSRIRKLTQDKEDAERNLIKLVNCVWKSKNKELKAYCTRFIVRTKDSLLNSDVRAEIDQFMTQSSNSKQRLADQELGKLHSLDTIKEVNEDFHVLEHSTDLVKDARKSRGLATKCVWTVKDKEGFIEKLYEYDTDFDNGDTVRRIRQYSVYYDKDCLLDVSSSPTPIQNTNMDLTSLHYQYTDKRITGSPAFQKFLVTNKIVVLPKASPPLALPPLIC